MAPTTENADEKQMLTNHFLLPICFCHSRFCYYDYGIVFTIKSKMTCDTSPHNLHLTSQETSFLQFRVIFS